jgi:16S rRNA (guanine966-N2)-methyltransferase
MKRPAERSGPGRLRIIGGSLRNSRIEVPDLPGLRPTPERVRETLFNWLMPVIDGARCLDLFAGTGALGIEALSRGAAWVDFIERDAALARNLRGNLERLRQDRGAVRGGDALALLATAPAQRCDIVFVDPPFGADLWAATTRALELNEWLAPSALIYLEMPAQAAPALPINWSPHRESTAGAVRFALYRRSAPSAKL